MSVTSIYPVIQVDDPRASATFILDAFGFEETFATDWYVSLRLDSWELAFLQSSHPTIPEGFRHAVQGVLVNIEVDDAAAEWTRLRHRPDVAVRLELRDEAFGQRHFILEAPGGLLVDVIEEIAPSPDFAVAFAG